MQNIYVCIMAFIIFIGISIIFGITIGINLYDKYKSENNREINKNTNNNNIKKLNLPF